MSEEKNKVTELKEWRDNVLNKMSPSMCTAKWLQSTVTLYNGFTHSCHHPSPHKISIDAVKEKPSALHNTPIKFYARSEMLQGVQTKECNYCWNIENAGDHISDRTYKSASEWSLSRMKEVVDSGLGENINPASLEIAFENTCNFKCTYCTPEVSSRWMEEINQHGPYDLPKTKMHDLSYLKQIGKFPIRHDEENEYINAFWKWWPDLYPSLDIFRITGGEPLLSSHTWAVFDYIIANPRPDLTLAINTNMGVPRKLLDKLIEYTHKLSGKVKQFIVYTSCEATGKQTEYIRYGMDYNEFVDNCEHFLKNTHPTVWLSFMVTTSILCSSTFQDFLKLVLSLRGQYSSFQNQHRVRMMISYIRYPLFLNIQLLPPDLKAKYAKEWTEFAKSNARPVLKTDNSFYVEEVDQIERLVEFMLHDNDNYAANMADFAAYHAQYDIRRSTSFNETFPELMPFMEDCKKLLIK